MKKFLVILCCVAISISIKAQQMVTALPSVGEIPMGDKTEIVLKLPSGDLKVLEMLRSKKFELRLDKFVIAAYTITEVVPNESFKLSFDCPKELGLAGKEKKLLLRDEQAEVVVKLNIFSTAPVMKEMFPGLVQTPGDKVVFTDVLEAQDLILKVDNYAAIERITFTDESVRLVGANSNSIDYTNSDFRVNPSENLIILKAHLLGVKSMQVKLFYIAQGTLVETPTVAMNDPYLRLDRRYLGGTFTLNPKKLYVDDFFDQSLKPLIRVDLKEQGQVGTDYTFSLVGTNPQVTGIAVKVKGTTNAKARYIAGKDIELELPNILSAGSYELTANPPTGGGNTLSAELNILPEPKIDRVCVLNSTSLELVRKFGNKYTINIKGAKLEQMTDVKIELVGKDPGNSRSFTLARDPGYQRDGLGVTLAFDSKDPNLIPIGDFQVRLVRTGNDPLMPRMYDSDNYIKISYPKLIDPKQIEMVELANAHFVPDEDLRESQRYDKLRRIRVIRPESPLLLNIKPSGQLQEKGPQFLDVQAVYYKSNGSESKIQWTEGATKSISIAENEVVYDLRNALEIKEKLGINEKIFVTVKHSSEAYGPINSSLPITYKYYREVGFWDRFGITASIPPYMITGRKVARKTITKDASGAVVDVKYDGEKMFEVQSLVINAGLGFKYRFKDRNYENSNFALTTYLMGMNFSDSKNRSEQINQEGNYDIIGNGSFNMLVMGEFSIANLDSINTRIPIYFGSAIVFKPLDKGQNMAWMLGLGIEIKIGH
ncbi:hypothetical protein [Pedobacter sp. D749]|uniref:hypothetical protein n=1 Tax=Pedobacter sp. D749 TaxID=2856523 RepID=UPI001C576BB4|nr:hypothetical protein [Pedobacter sp. D749]QXU42797.1 hypothetical protein KYH19_04140 [Pedobacter sp. D749]